MSEAEKKQLLTISQQTEAAYQQLAAEKKARADKIRAAAETQRSKLNQELGGVAEKIGGLTLVPGLYKFTGEAHIEGSDVTLEGGPDDVWIFQCAVDLQMEAGVNRSVILAGGARAKNIFWQVGTAAVLGTYSVFKGTIMAGTSITMDLGGTMEGRALAFAQVTFGSSGGSLPSTNGSSQVITNFIPVTSSVFAGTNKVGLSAQASSGLPVWSKSEAKFPAVPSDIGLMAQEAR